MEEGSDQRVPFWSGGLQRVSGLTFYPINLWLSSVVALGESIMRVWFGASNALFLRVLLVHVAVQGDTLEIAKKVGFSHFMSWHVFVPELSRQRPWGAGLTAVSCFVHHLRSISMASNSISHFEPCLLSSSKWDFFKKRPTHQVREVRNPW